MSLLITNNFSIDWKKHLGSWNYDQGEWGVNRFHPIRNSEHICFLLDFIIGENTFFKIVSKDAN